MGKTQKTTAGGRKKIKDLSPKNAKAVAGGRKAGEAPKEYLNVKLSDVLVSSY